MENEIQIRPDGMPAEAPQTEEQIKQRMEVIHNVVKSVMKQSIHYGQVPGTNGMTLLKPGADLLLATFRIALDPKVEDLSTEDEIRYRITVTGVHQVTGQVVGTGLGECSSNESKYKWKRAEQAEYDATPETRRRMKHGSKWGQQRGQRVPTLEMQVRTEPADQANTVLKMAKKRAAVDLCLTTLAASDMFDVTDRDFQDANDAGPQGGMDYEGEYQREPAQQSSGPPGVATEKQVGFLRNLCRKADLAEGELLREFQLASMENMPFDKVNDAIAWIESQGGSR